MPWRPDGTIADEHDHSGNAGPDVKIEHEVPVHELSVFDGCKSDDIEDNHEACFRIYEGTAVELEHNVPCKGVRTAFGDGRLRANGMKTYTEKAWAMRDAFDGLLNATRHWFEKNHASAGQRRARRHPGRRLSRADRWRWVRGGGHRASPGIRLDYLIL